jgi:hypothetical protein
VGGVGHDPILWEWIVPPTCRYVVFIAKPARRELAPLV